MKATKPATAARPAGSDTVVLTSSPQRGEDTDEGANHTKTITAYTVVEYDPNGQVDNQLAIFDQLSDAIEAAQSAVNPDEQAGNVEKSQIFSVADPAADWIDYDKDKPLRTFHRK